MRFLTLGGAALYLAGCGGGSVDCEANPTDPSCPADCVANPSDSRCGGTYSGPSGGTAPPAPECLDINTLTMSMAYGWDAASGQAVSTFNPFSGATENSFFRINLGPAGWTGDTSLPGPPDNWCFIEWNLDGTTDSNTDPAFWLQIAQLDAGDGTTNCGRESSPGAGDAVDLCGGFFGGADPVADFGPLNWTFRFGGDVDAEVANVPDYFAGYGYTTDNFWGADMSSDVFATNPVETLSYGWQVDANGDVVVDGNNEPIRFTKYDAQGPGGLNSGYFTHVIPWIFTFN